MAFIAGPATGQYDSSNIGQLEDGFDLQLSHHYEEVRGDNLADAIQELITRGEDAYLGGTLIEADLIGAGSPATGIRKLIWPNHATFGTIGQVGRVVTTSIGGSTIAKSLVFTRVAGTTADVATLTAALSVIAPGFRIAMKTAPRLKRIPFLMVCLPNSSGVLFAAA